MVMQCEKSVHDWRYLMAEQLSYVIIGNGIAGATAAEILREEESEATVTVVADDPFPVYYRPALKDYLAGKVREDKLWARPMTFYADRHIRFLTERVVGIQPGQHTLQLRSGSMLPYSRLLLAHGARASQLTCPGAHLLGVSTLRSVADYQRVLSRLNAVRRVVVVGSGTLALETIETLRHRGYQATHLIRGQTLWSEVLDPTASDLVVQQEQRDGVDVLLEQEIGEIVGINGQVTGVITKAGMHLACEMVLIGIGIEPHIDFLQAAGIACGRGVKVDGAMRTNVPDIYAAGDVLETVDALTKRARVLGQWYPCIQQARAAAYSMLDLLDAKTPLPFGNFYNATFLYGLDFASVGLSTLSKGGQGYQEIIADPQPRTYQKVILKDGIAVGVLTLGDRKRALALKRAIDYRVNIQPVLSQVFHPDFHLSKWLDAQGVPTLLPGVNRQGGVAVRQVAYGTGEKHSTLLDQQELTEAALIPVLQATAQETFKDTYVSQTRVTLIGRQPGATLCINHPSISRRHAEITFANGHYVLRDLGGTNGTFINGVRIEPKSITLLKSDDVLHFGQVKDTAFAFRLRQSDPASSMLFNQQKTPPSLSAADGVAFPQGGQMSGDGSLGPTRAGRRDSLSSAPSGQPVLNADGSLFLPGATSAVPASTVARMKQGAALVALMQGEPLVFFLHPRQRCILGRIPECDIVLSDMSVSRKHAEISPAADGFHIRDLGSSNGVSVNQTRLDNPYHLAGNDRIMIGNVPAYFLETREPASNLTLPAQRQAEYPGSVGVAQTRANGAVSAAQASSGVFFRFCQNCGTKSDGSASFCPMCGMRLF
jgi:NADPH-dependent 2,4-dienoyl-CoA reductase/sulfur reductase-like enzyme/pSer/pThr/pTyr-binding forkhead associated (FHA) protein